MHDPSRRNGRVAESVHKSHSASIFVPHELVLENGDSPFESIEDNNINGTISFNAPEFYSPYGPPCEGEFSEMLTATVITKRSRLWTVVGPRDRTRSQRPNAQGSLGAAKWKDMEAFAVRQANHLISSEVIRIRDGREEMPEYDLAENIVVPVEQIKVTGWARRPPRGKQYGTSYIETYRDEIKEMFDKGSQVSTDKLRPAAMLETLQEKYPCRYSLPGENEIRQEITRIMGTRRSQIDPLEYNPDVISTENNIQRRRSNIPEILIKAIADLMDEEPLIKPAAALARLKATFLQIGLLTEAEFPEDKTLKAKISSLKPAKKRKEKANLM